VFPAAVVGVDKGSVSGEPWRGQMSETVLALREQRDTSTVRAGAAQSTAEIKLAS